MDRYPFWKLPQFVRDARDDFEKDTVGQKAPIFDAVERELYFKEIRNMERYDTRLMKTGKEKSLADFVSAGETIMLADGTTIKNPLYKRKDKD